MTKSKKNNHWTKYLEKMYACDAAVKWCKKFKSPGDAWRALCSNGVTKQYYYWILESFLPVENCDTRCCYCCCFKKSQYPVPTVSDLKQAASGKTPWVWTN